MAESIRFDQRVAIVTGAGGGLGRSHAVALAQRGAMVVVNDLGGSVQGQGGDQAAAQIVVDEITAAGGKALANFDNIATPHGAQAMVDAAIKAFGRVDGDKRYRLLLGIGTTFDLPNLLFPIRAHVSCESA